jgi:hypothetical protein
MSDMLLLAQLVNMPSKETLKLFVVVGSVFLLLAGWIAVFLVPIVIWRRSVRRRGYPGLMAYLRELPQTQEDKMDAVELTLKGVVICALGLLIPPLVLVGLVPLYYGARKLASVTLGIKAAGDTGQFGRSE